MNVDRYYGPSLKPFGNLSKTVRIIDQRHLEWLREQPCIITGFNGGCDPHHLQKKSQIQNDYLAIPLRHDVHMEFHALEWEAFEEKHKVDLKDALIAKLVEKIVILEDIVKCRNK